MRCAAGSQPKAASLRGPPASAACRKSWASCFVQARMPRAGPHASCIRRLQEKLEELLYSDLFCQQVSEPCTRAAVRIWGAGSPKRTLARASCISCIPCRLPARRLCATASCPRARKWSSLASSSSQSPGEAAAAAAAAAASTCAQRAWKRDPQLCGP